MAQNREIWEHKSWLGYVQPEGLVVSPPALVAAGYVIDRDIHERQAVLRDCCPVDPAHDQPLLRDFPEFASRVLDWQSEDLVTFDEHRPVPAELEVVLAHYGETLRPDYAVVREGRTLMLVQMLPAGTRLEKAGAATAGGWQASPLAKFERLIRETGVEIGLLCNGSELCLVYAPGGESVGWLRFPIVAMTEVAGRDILGACHMLLGEARVISALEGGRLDDVLRASRKFQNEVSTRLAEQVLAGLNALLHGFQAADEHAGGRLIGRASGLESQEIYAGLLTVIMRAVFLLYAEDAGLMPTDPLYVEHYSFTGLYEKLRRDASHHPDTMDQRFGAWSRLLSLFRLVFSGGGHGAMHLPARKGLLFDPETHAFLEGRPRNEAWQPHEQTEVPRVSDGCIYRLLDNLLVLDGERLSYRALDVEQIGSVYEAMMGYDIERARGATIAVRPHHVYLDLEDLLRRAPAERIKRLKAVGCDLGGKAATAFKQAQTVDDAVAALGRKRSPRTPEPLPTGSLYLQPGEERRRTGSHYTPRALTAPIVADTLAPRLRDLGPKPLPEAVLALRICDPAMGSGAFLVETCRQLAEQLVAAWEIHDLMPPLPPDEDPLLHARRLIAQRCLYGLDKNPFAVNLAKLSLWLVTLARDHPFTFLDHALKHGDSLVGIGRDRIAAFHWLEQKGYGPLFDQISDAVDAAGDYRARIHALGDGGDDEKRDLHWQAEAKLLEARLAGDLVVAAFFNGAKPRAREQNRVAYQKLMEDYRVDRVRIEGPQAVCDGLRHGAKPIHPFHWEIEFPEVFGRANPGFDAVLGNPPFAGKNTTASANTLGYSAWLRTVHEQAHGNADLVAHFFRLAFGLLRRDGTLGLIATNTIAQGDTRHTGLRWLCTHGGTIYKARRRLKWPGQVAVVVSVVHLCKCEIGGPFELDGRTVPLINAFLSHKGGHENPHSLAANQGKSFQGNIVLSMGFTFDDTDRKGAASSIAQMERLIEKDPRNGELIFPYIGGNEVLTNSIQTPHRYVINFGDMTEHEARQWPDLMAIVENKVKPGRMKTRNNLDGKRRKLHWWLWERYRKALYYALSKIQKRILVIPRPTPHFAFTFISKEIVISEQLICIAWESNCAFCSLQSRVHEIWARFFSGTALDLLRYTPSGCFRTFPFPEGWQADRQLEHLGREYHDYRAELMVANDEGLTATYNRFHDPDERDPAIIELRERHAAMDAAVLAAYGWSDIPTECQFLLDYEIDEETWSAGRKRPYRLRWPEPVHDEVLARLLALNQARFEAEQLAGAGAQAKTSAGRLQVPDEPIRPKTGRAKKRADPGQGSLFDRGETS